MTQNSANITINYSGNAISATGELQQNLENASGAANGFGNTIQQLSIKLAVFNQASQAIQELSNSLMRAVQPGVDFDKSLQSLSAIMGETGDGLDRIGMNARTLALEFGTSAGQSVDSFTKLLSELGPHLASGCTQRDG